VFDPRCLRGDKSLACLYRTEGMILFQSRDSDHRIVKALRKFFSNLDGGHPLGRLPSAYADVVALKQVDRFGGSQVPQPNGKPISLQPHSRPPLHPLSAASSTSLPPRTLPPIRIRTTHHRPPIPSASAKHHSNPIANQLPAASFKSLYPNRPPQRFNQPTGENGRSRYSTKTFREVECWTCPDLKTKAQMSG
jgi:hypothetical protein